METKSDNLDIPFVSIIMPVKNGLPYLEECLESIRAQTYKNFTLLVWNDDSNDGTLDLLNQWIPAKLPGKVFSGKVSCVGEALANLVNLANTELIARMDADDVNYVRRLEKQVGYMIAHPDISVLGTNASVSTTGESGYFPHTHNSITHFALHHNPLLHPSVIFRRKDVLDVGNYRNFKMEDYDLWLRMLSKYKFASLTETLLYYRRHAAQITAKPMFQSDEEVFYATALELWGCYPYEVYKLRNHQLRFALPLYIKIARHLEKNTLRKMGILRRLFSISLLSVFLMHKGNLDHLLFLLTRKALARINKTRFFLKSL